MARVEPPRVISAAALRRCGIDHDAPIEITGLTADSRQVEPGFLFAVLPGTRTHGAAFLDDAIARGAAVLLTGAGAAPLDARGATRLVAADERRAYALLAAEFHAPAPEVIVAVTGTNGKTSTVDFLRQLWTIEGRRAASIGTLGVIAPGWPRRPALTTPEPAALHATLARLAREGVTHVAIEASSHGLEQRRLDGVRLAAAGFTNLTRDHLDHHGTMEAYRAAKLRLFEGGPALEGGALAHAEMDPTTLAALRACAPGLRTVGPGGDLVRLDRLLALPDGQALTFDVLGLRHDLVLRLSGRFQADNALLALGLAIASGSEPHELARQLWLLQPVPGRLEAVASLPNKAVAYVDYAHTPDAIARLCEALRPHVAPGARLHLLFGAGGDRDPGKRVLMGEAAARGADQVWVTDDNPRSEDPAAIRRAVLAGAPGAIDAGARDAAIAAALLALGPADVLAVAGKGHETGQEIAGVVHPFDDAEAIRRHVRGMGE